MPPRAHPDDERNSSFGPARATSHDAKPGVVPAEEGDEAPAAGDHQRRTPDKPGDAKPLADRIREREGGGDG
jgi:hypothetical protein